MRIILFLALVTITIHTFPPSAMAEEEKGYMESLYDGLLKFNGADQSRTKKLSYDSAPQKDDKEEYDPFDHDYSPFKVEKAKKEDSPFYVNKTPKEDKVKRIQPRSVHKNMELDRWDLHNSMSSEEVLQYQLSPK